MALHAQRALAARKELGTAAPREGRQRRLHEEGRREDGNADGTGDGGHRTEGVLALSNSSLELKPCMRVPATAPLDSALSGVLRGSRCGSVHERCEPFAGAGGFS